MGIFILLIISITCYYLGTAFQSPKKINTDTDKFYTEYHRLIFNNPIFYKVAGAHLLSVPCDKCKTIYGGCPLNTRNRARLNWNEENCFHHRYEWEHRFK